MKQYRVHASEDFYNQFVSLSMRLNDLRAMFANDGHVISREQLIEWHGIATTISGELEELIDDSMARFESI